MKYIYTDDFGITHFDKYFTYIESIKSSLPSHVYNFAQDFRYYSLEDYESLHDAWVEKIEVVEGDEVNDRLSCEMTINVNLLGPRHDRTIKLSYLGVETYQNHVSIASNGNGSKGHGDLLVHEIRVENSLIVHELEFGSGSITITCKNMMHSETKLDLDDARST